MTTQQARTSVADLTTTRATDPGAITRGWAARERRPLLGGDGRMLLVAADHPARGALGVRGDRLAMASRSDLLRRLATALSRPGVDGVLGTPDVLDDLLLMGALEGKVAIGSMNRGGLQGSAFELDDRFTGHTAAEIVARGIDGGGPPGGAMAGSRIVPLRPTGGAGRPPAARLTSTEAVSPWRARSSSRT